MDQETVCKAKKEAEEAWTKVALLKDAYYKAEKDYMEKVTRFRALDYELALIDGRLKKLPPAGKETKKTQKQPELTLEQLKAIATKLGFNLNEVEVVDEEEVEDEEV